MIKWLRRDSNTRKQTILWQDIFEFLTELYCVRDPLVKQDREIKKEASHTDATWDAILILSCCDTRSLVSRKQRKSGDSFTWGYAVRAYGSCMQWIFIGFQL